MKYLPSVIACLLLAFTLPSVAQQPVPPNSKQPPPPTAPAPKSTATLEAQLSSSSIGVAEQAMLSIRVPDGKRLESYPSVIEVSGLDIQYSGTSMQSYSLGGRMMRSIELRYLIEGLEPGTYTIPEQMFSVDGKQLASKSIQLVVSEGARIDEALQPQAQLEVDKTEMWEGEVVPVAVKVLMHRAIQTTSLPFPQVKTDGIAVSRFDRPGRVDQAEINGQIWNAWQMPSAMTPLKPGDITLGPAEVKLELLMPMSGASRDPFGNFPSMRRSLKIKSNTVPIHVKPLPVDGRPAGFTGAVGRFQLAVRTDTPGSGQHPVPVGDPVGFELSITGIGNFDAVEAPVLEKSDGLRTYKPKMSLENRGLGTEPGQKGFTQIVFTEKPGPLSVVYLLPYFDPSTGSYAVAKSAPVELIVTGELSAVAAASNAAAGETRDYNTNSEAAVPGEDLHDILPQPLSGTRWYSLAGVSAPVHPLLLHGVPALLLALLLGTGTLRRLRAWQISRRPPAYAPRDCALIARDLHRGRLSLLQFYGFVSEYVNAWQFWRRSPLPPPDDRLANVLAARDRWLYAANTEAASAPVPADEQAQTASILTSRLSA